MSKASGSIDLKALKAAGANATEYITEIDSAGIFISPSNQSPTTSAPGNSVRINGEGMDVYKDGVSVAHYGDTARIGKEEEAYLSLNSTEIKGCSGSKTYFQINSQGAVQEMWVAMGNVSWTGNGRYTWVLNEAHDDVKIDRGTWIEVVRSGYDYTTAWSSISTGDPFKVSLWFQYTNPSDGTKRDYKTEVDFVKGTAKDWNLYTSSDVDAFDVIYDGSNTIAIDRRAANGVYWQRITPIYKVVSTTPVYTFGNSITSSNGSYSFLIGDGTQSNYPYQLVIGKYNTDTDATLVIGNGTADGARSNALTVDRQGNVEAAGEVIGATSKTVITTFSSGWDVYSTDPAAPVTLRRCGKFVDLTGMIKNTTAVTLNATQVTIFTIPEGYRPSQTMTILSQGSSMNVFAIRIKASGDVTFERYRSTNSTSTSYSSISEGAWFPIHAAWIMD